MSTRTYNIMIRWNWKGGWPVLPIWFSKAEIGKHAQITWMFINLEVHF